VFGKKRGRDGQEGSEDKGKAPQRGAGSQQQNTDSAIKTGFADGRSEGENTEYENHGILGIGLGHLIGGKHTEKIHQNADQQGSDTDGNGTGGPEKCGHQQDAHHGFGTQGNLLGTQGGFDHLSGVVGGFFIQFCLAGVKLSNTLTDFHLVVIGIARNGFACLPSFF